MSVISGTVGAVMGSNATSDAAAQSASAQNTATNAQTAIYNQQRSDFEPYRQIGLGALPYLASAMTGQSYSIVDPQYVALSVDELTALNKNKATYDPSKAWVRGADGKIYRADQVTMSESSTENPARIGIPYYGPAMPTAGYTPLSADEISKLNGAYSPSQQWYRSPTGEILSADQVPRIQASFNPAQSPAAKYQLEHGNTALMRSLGARGLAGSGYAPSKLAELSSSVAASDWTNQYNRLLDLVKIGTGASSSTGAAASNLSNAYGQGAQNLGNIYSQAGANKASLYSGMGSASANTFGTGLRAYQAGQQAGWWGGGSGAASDEAIKNAYAYMEA